MLLALLMVAQAAAAAPGNAATSPSSAAWHWLLGQRGSQSVSSDSRIELARDYPGDWTGPVAGTFTPVGITSPVIDQASLTVDNPAEVADSGIVVGHVLVAPRADRWVVQVYRRAGGQLTRQPLQTLVQADGTFSVDLGSIRNPDAGSWALGLLDATSSYAPYGQPWPSRVYADWQVRAYVVTDTAYLIGSQPASADDTFAFESSRPGQKVVELVDVSSGAVLARYAPDFGLVRSFATGNRVYSYDQALVVLVGVSRGAPQTATLTAGLLQLQQPDGGFADSADVRNPAAALPLERSGITAVAAYALLRSLQSDPDQPDVRSAVAHALDWLVQRLRPDGLVGAGVGQLRADGSFVAGADPGWASTEHNLDTWQAFRLAAEVLGEPRRMQDANTLADAIMQRLWAGDRFRQGVAPDGSADNTDTLDVNAWGALFLGSLGRPDLARLALAHAGTFASGVGQLLGYRAYVPQPAFPAAPANVWTEGTASVALARIRLGDSGAASDRAHLEASQRSDGSFACAQVADDPTSMTTQSCVAGTAWFLLAASPDGGGLPW